jgi:hypothetical protein
MTPQELYNLLVEAGVEYEIVEIFEGARILNIEVEEPVEEEEQIELNSISSETLDGIYTNAMHLAHHLRMAGMNDEANEIEKFGIQHGRRNA